MNLKIFENMSESELITYIEFLFGHYRIVDSFWFIFLEQDFGRDTAEKINEKVWTRVGPMAFKDIRKRFNIREKGLEGFVKTLKLFPWTSISNHQIEKKGNEVIFTVPKCPPQVARIERGLGEYDCKDMHMNTFINLVNEVDPNIQVRCEFAPPDPHPDDLFCKWRFYLE